MISFVSIRKRKDTHGPKSPCRAKSKVFIVEKPIESPVNPSTKAHGRTSLPGSKALNTLRKRSIRIFSILRNGNSNSKSSIPTVEHATSSSNASTSVASKDPKSFEAPRTQVKNIEQRLSLPSIPISIPLPTFHRRNSSSPQMTNIAGLDGISEPYLSTQHLNLPPLHTSKSTPGLSRQLSNKLSEALLYNNTVIHRPKLSSRPAVRASHKYLDNHSQPVTPSKSAMSNPASLSSSTLNSSSSPISQSTAPTSIVSLGAPTSAESKRRIHVKFPSAGGSTHSPQFSESSRKHRIPPSLLVPRQDAPRLAKPSVATIENAAAAKVFFENYFNQLLGAKPSQRSLRRRQMELKLFAMTLSNEDRQQRRRQWYAAESHHLRQYRVMKSKTLARQKMKGVHISHYEVVRILGKGSFGVVRLVRLKLEPSGFLSGVDCSMQCVDGASVLKEQETVQPPLQYSPIYAMKIIRKSDMLRNTQEGHLRAERDFLVASENSKWVVPLMAAFQDSSHLYLVMEYMIGGDFLGLLLREDVLDESVARWYLGEMILCIEEAHRMNWIHRDVKPDNFLITASGHLKISDFGLAFDGHWIHNQSYYNEQRDSLVRDLQVKIEGDAQDVEEERERQSANKTLSTLDGSFTEHGSPEPKQDAANTPILDWRNRMQRRRFAQSLVGTSQYMAPEVVRGESYDGRCDWWSIGIILYECIYGITPFFCDNRQATKARILNHRHWLRFPPEERFARPNSDRVPLEPVTSYAIDLMMRLLQDRPARLSTKRYHQNDRIFRDKANATRRARNVVSSGHICFPNDAEDIKSHPFFYGTNWTTLHRERPPFVPQVRGGQPITKYFEAETDILGTSDHLHSSSYETIPEGYAMPSATAPPFSPFNDADGNHSPATELRNGDVYASPGPQVSPSPYPPLFSTALLPSMRRRTREKKRPRDKMLRDPVVGHTALELRKKGAFVGYTYRRPMFCFPDVEERLGEMQAQVLRPLGVVGPGASAARQGCWK